VHHVVGERGDLDLRRKIRADEADAGIRGRRVERQGDPRAGMQPDSGAAHLLAEGALAKLVHLHLQAEGGRGTFPGAAVERAALQLLRQPASTSMQTRRIPLDRSESAISRMRSAAPLRPVDTRKSLLRESNRDISVMTAEAVC